MSIWKRTMDYLGLGPDDAYDDYDDYEQDEPPPRTRRESEARGARARTGDTDAEGVVRTTPARPTFPSRDFDPSPTRRALGADDSGIQPRPSRAGLRAVTPTAEPHAVRPVSFNQAQEVADKFKEGQPVIMNLEGTDRETSRRLIDFASGLCYALDGTMEKVATGVYLLKPHLRSARDDYDD